MVKKLVLCFDRARRHPDADSVTNAHRLFHLLGDDGQIGWYHPGVSMADPWTRWSPLSRREAAADDARAAIADAYQFLVDRWVPGDRIYLFGVGRGAYCAQTLTRLLAIVGVLPDLMDYVLSAYALPRTQRSNQDWERVTDVASQLLQQRQIGLPVWYLGLWDTLRIPGFTRRTMPDPMPNVEHGRHAVAIDGPFGERLVSSSSDRIEEVWFRGAHRDVVGGAGACRPLAGIAFDWMLDGAIAAGLTVHRGAVGCAPTQADALAETAHTIAVRRLPAGATVHASVDPYLRAHRQYWKRMPADVAFCDPGWAARGAPTTRPVSVPADAVPAVA